MKPAVTMDEKPTIVIPTVGQAEPARQSSRMKSRVVLFIIGIVSVLIVVGMLLGAFHLGRNTTSENYKEAWIRFSSGDDTMVSKERLTVREKEKEVVISRPGTMKMVLDYAKNVIVMRYYNDDKDPSCFVYDFEPGMFGSLEDNERAVRDAERNQTVYPGNEVLSFENTGETVSLEDLSLSAMEMCYGTKIVRVVKKEETGVQKRAADDCMIIIIIDGRARCAIIIIVR